MAEAFLAFAPPRKRGTWSKESALDDAEALRTGVADARGLAAAAATSLRAVVSVDGRNVTCDPDGRVGTGALSAKRAVLL